MKTLKHMLKLQQFLHAGRLLGLAAGLLLPPACLATDFRTRVRASRLA